MNKEVKSKICETKSLNNAEYEITFISIDDFAFIKRMDERITYPDVSGLGHYVSNVLDMDENGVLHYSVIPHNEYKSSGLSYDYKVIDLSEKDFESCQSILNHFMTLIDAHFFSEEATKVFYDFLTKINEISNEKSVNKTTNK